jgi:hypothetical protein
MLCKKLLNVFLLCLTTLAFNFSAFGANIINNTAGNITIHVIPTLDCKAGMPTYAISIEPKQVVSTGIPSETHSNSMCVFFENPTVASFDSQPIKDVHECTLEVDNVVRDPAGRNNYQRIKATPACNYKGRCPGGLTYAKEDKVCCPNGFWKEGANAGCQSFKVE